MNRPTSTLQFPKLAEDTSDLQCQRAGKLSQFATAFRIIHASYSQRGLISRNRAGLWMNQHHLISSTSVFLARSWSRTQGTLSLVEDGPLGLPMETLFLTEVQQQRRQRPGRIAEATCLALEQRPDANGAKVVNRLMGAVAQTAARSGVTQILIAVHPRHAPYYTRLAGFRAIGPPRPYSAVRGQLAVPLALHLPTLHTECPSSYRRFFGMRFPTALLTRAPIAPTTLQQLGQMWQIIQHSALETPQQTTPPRSANRRAA